MSFRSNSPWTRTSRPSFSWSFIHSAIFFWLKEIYCSFVIAPFLYEALFARTSFVWGNEPIVVVGKSGSLKALCWIFSRSKKSGFLMKSSSFSSESAFCTLCVLKTRSLSKSFLLSENDFSSPKESSFSSESFSSAKAKCFLMSQLIFSSDCVV